MKMAAPASPSPACEMGEGAKDDATNGLCLKRIDDDYDDDKRCESSSFYGNSDDSILSTLSDLTDDATSTSPSSSSSLSSNASQFDPNQSSFDLSSLVDDLPIKRGLSKYFEGKSESFRSLSDARCIEDLVKKVNPSRKRLKASGDHGFNSTQKHCNRSRFHGRTTWKKTSRGSTVSSLLARRNRSTALFSSKMLNLPPHENLQ
ncbi:uncharacterized protein LOC122040810 [Zingiber officinale]|uniref:Oxidative stress 3 n=1 Tax=Zingiber officinale TaxID=94328 RepID=A0A8J5HTZ8_ZINOF|nr:uncharacterized protein LOC122040810 [Zingiber officinale]KAG6527337.1 hypothetical protein ZIOFF_009436 [Zingiber officinale]